MYWKGIGVEQDRALGYAWMDLAAERLYHDFVLYRERYWKALSRSERADAISRGQALLAEYGDDVAKPRLELRLFKEKRMIAGSRLGFIGPLTILPMTGCFGCTGRANAVQGDKFWKDKYWEPKQYWRMQDEIWKAPLREKVEVGEVENVRDAQGEESE